MKNLKAGFMRDLKEGFFSEKTKKVIACAAGRCPLFLHGRGLTEAQPVKKTVFFSFALDLWHT